MDICWRGNAPVIHMRSNHRSFKVFRCWQAIW